MKIHCPWCSKMVLVYKGRLCSHVSFGKIKCVGIGQPAVQVRLMNERRGIK